MKSRSHPREVVLGLKKISLEGAKQIGRGLKLPNDLNEYFLLLAENELAKNSKSRTFLKEEIEKSRLQIQRRVKSKNLNPKDFYSISQASLVYAALGSIENGATLDELVMKTRINPEQVQAIIRNLELKKFIVSHENLYFPTDRHLSFSDLKEGENFQSFYLSRLKQLQKRVSKSLTSDSELFWEATLSVKASKLNELKEELRQVLIRFAEGAEASDGESLRSVTIGYFDPRTGV